MPHLQRTPCGDTRRLPCVSTSKTVVCSRKGGAAGTRFRCRRGAATPGELLVQTNYVYRLPLIYDAAPCGIGDLDPPKSQSTGRVFLVWSPEQCTRGAGALCCEGLPLGTMRCIPPTHCFPRPRAPRGRSDAVLGSMRPGCLAGALNPWSVLFQANFGWSMGQ